jgi:hypothetical protein
MKRIIVIIVSLMLSGCIFPLEIVPVGKETYMVEHSSDNLSRLYRAANKFCAERNQALQPVREFNLAGGHKSTLTFRCLNENDPELTRPVMEPTYPKQKIEQKIEVIQK